MEYIPVYIIFDAIFVIVQVIPDGVLKKFRYAKRGVGGELWLLLTSEVWMINIPVVLA